MKKFTIEYGELNPKTFKKGILRQMTIEANDPTHAKWKMNMHQSLIKSVQEV